MNITATLISGLDSATRQHNRDLPKPNEDRMLCLPEDQIFIILDGITRVHQEYFDHPYTSVAGEIGDILIQVVTSYLKANASRNDMEALLREAVKLGNDEIARFRSRQSKENWGFYPGTLGIISVIRKGRLHYICNGDCIGMILRNNSKICFGEQLQLAALETMQISKADRYNLYCNHPKNKLSYTIFNGDSSVPETCEYASIALEPRDVLILATDGIKNYLKYESVDTLLSSSAEELIDLSVAFDVAPFGKYSDDKSLIKFTYQL